MTLFLLAAGLLLSYAEQLRFVWEILIPCTASLSVYISKEAYNILQSINALIVQHPSYLPPHSHVDLTTLLCYVPFSFSFSFYSPLPSPGILFSHSDFITYSSCPPLIPRYTPRTSHSFASACSETRIETACLDTAAILVITSTAQNVINPLVFFSAYLCTFFSICNLKHSCKCVEQCGVWT